MRTRKTPTSQRKIYKLHTVDENLHPIIKILKPGEDGISEELIHTMHAIDDSEYYYNTRATDPHFFLRPEDKHALAKEKKRWAAVYIREFKNQHGYEPHPDDVDAAMREAFPHDKVFPLEKEMKPVISDEPDPFEFVEKKEEEAECLACLHELIQTLPENWQQVYKRAMLGKRKRADVAAELGMSKKEIDFAVKEIREKISNSKTLLSFLKEK